MARQDHEAANFVFVQLIEQQPGIYDKRHPDYGRRDKTDIAWENISREMNESGMCVYICRTAHEGNWQPKCNRNFREF
jgi:hypothetical protein